jgi:hypothetical protein
MFTSIGYLNFRREKKNNTDLFVEFSLNEDVYQTPMTMSDDLSKNQQSNQMKRKKSTSKSRRYRYNEGREIDFS